MVEKDSQHWWIFVLTIQWILPQVGFIEYIGTGSFNCLVSECPLLRRDLLPNGDYNCFFQGQEIKDRFPAGSKCTLECKPGIFDRPVFPGDKLYCIEDYAGFKEGYLDGCKYIDSCRCVFGHIGFNYAFRNEDVPSH